VAPPIAILYPNQLRSMREVLDLAENAHHFGGRRRELVQL
jgi:hypothetical protein